MTTRKELTMRNLVLASAALAFASASAFAQAADLTFNSDRIATIAIQCLNNASPPAVVACPSSDTFTVASSMPASLTAAYASVLNVPSVVLTPKVQASPSINVTLTDSAGLVAKTINVALTYDPATPVALGMNLSTVTYSTQLTPTAPGP
jgi:hypothetical protein